MMSETIQTVRQYGQLVIAFDLPTQCRSREEGQVGTRASERINIAYFIQPFKNAVLSKNLDQSMPKDTYFWKKSCKITAASGTPSSNPRWPPAAGGSASRSSHYYFRLLL